MTLNMFATTDEVMSVNLVYFNTFRNSVKKDKKGGGGGGEKPPQF